MLESSNGLAFGVGMGAHPIHVSPQHRQELDVMRYEGLDVLSFNQGNITAIEFIGHISMYNIRHYVTHVENLCFLLSLMRQVMT